MVVNSKVYSKQWKREPWKAVVLVWYSESLPERVFIPIPRMSQSLYTLFQYWIIVPLIEQSELREDRDRLAIYSHPFGSWKGSFRTKSNFMLAICTELVPPLCKPWDWLVLYKVVTRYRERCRRHSLIFMQVCRKPSRGLFFFSEYAFQILFP